MANDDKTILTQDSYRNRPGAQRWSQEETTEFYAVSQAGLQASIGCGSACLGASRAGAPALMAGGGDLQLLLRGQLQCRPAWPVVVLVWGPGLRAWGQGWMQPARGCMQVLHPCCLSPTDWQHRGRCSGCKQLEQAASGQDAMVAPHKDTACCLSSCGYGLAADSSMRPSAVPLLDLRESGRQHAAGVHAAKTGTPACSPQPPLLRRPVSA